MASQPPSCPRRGLTSAAPTFAAGRGARAPKRKYLSLCWHLFERTPFAWEKARQWSASPREFVRRAGFALMAGLALHDRAAADSRFLAFLPLVEKGARDERNFVKKGVSWALRAIGRRNVALNEAALVVAKRLAASDEASPRWVGKDGLRELASPRVRAQLVRRAR